MKYYIYVSTSKIEMLYSQIASSSNQTREACIGFDIKLLKGHVKDARGLAHNEFTRLNDVLAALDHADVVGSIDDKKPYIRATLRMQWATQGDIFRNHDKSAITFWGYGTSDHPFPGTVLALAGSKHHLLGEQRTGSAHSHSGTEAMTLWFLDNLDEPDLQKQVPETLQERASSFLRMLERKELSDFDVANGAWLAATQVQGYKADYEFVAKVLHRSEWPDGFRSSSTKQVILGTPLYVALAE